MSIRTIIRATLRWLIAALVLLAPAFLGAADEPAAVVAIQPLGEVGAARLAAVRQALEKAYAIPVAVLPAKPLPPEAWYVPRKRYRADLLLDHLAARSPAGHRIVIGLTAKDISVTKDQHEDWGIFGLGQLDGRVCVVSTFRLGARGADEAKLLERLGKIAIHEAGHVMGLEHCAAPGCVMADAAGSIATVDAESGAFCQSCAKTWRKWREAKDP
jgi:archaemetzincin